VFLYDHFLPIYTDPTGPCLEGLDAVVRPRGADTEYSRRIAGDGKHL
jgi:hypothetical protein